MEDFMQSYLLPLIALFNENANPAQAAPMKSYMRDQFEYLGIKSPQFKSLFKEFIGEHGLPPSPTWNQSFTIYGNCRSASSNTWLLVSQNIWWINFQQKPSKPLSI
jgi:hypothetical protein